MQKKTIIARHIFTLFNFVNLVLALLVFSVHSYRNLLFLVVAIVNAVIGLVNELRAQKIINQLKLISEKKQIIVRNGQKIEVHSAKIQKGDHIIYMPGSQITVDAKIIEGTIEVNESFITGESDNIKKVKDDKLISGSFVMSGTCEAIAEAVGDDIFVNRLSKSAREIQSSTPKLFRIINQIIKYASIFILPVGTLLLISRLRLSTISIDVAVTSTVASLISMIPEGLVLLTSSVLALSSIRLAKQKVLVQDLYSIETLARADVICLDKTGTITDSDGKVRANATKIISYFYKNDITPLMISGDTIDVVERVAKEVKFKSPRIADLSKIANPDYGDLVKNYNIFAKATPESKKALVVALKHAGHVAAMTGDGVNDILAMKEADCSIAIGDGTDAARRVARFVLLDSDFAAIPDIIHEGRRTINNIERSATLFLSKTTYATILSIIFIFLPFAYPFSPIGMSFLNFACIGFPAFVLALEPNNERVKDRFIYNIKHLSIPTGILNAVSILTISIISHQLGFDHTLTTTIAMLATFTIDTILIYRISRPLNKLRLALFVVILFLAAIVFLIPPVSKFFGLVPLF